MPVRRRPTATTSMLDAKSETTAVGVRVEKQRAISTVVQPADRYLKRMMRIQLALR
jgi:hypothetical protein